MEDDLQESAEAASLTEPVGSARIVFTPSGKRGEFAVGTTVLAAARALGVDLDSVCGGRAVCGRCQVNPMVGEFAKHRISSQLDSLSLSSSTEQRYARIKGLDAGRRLSCSTTRRRVGSERARKTSSIRTSVAMPCAPRVRGAMVPAASRGVLRGGRGPC